MNDFLKPLSELLVEPCKRHMKTRLLSLILILTIFGFTNPARAGWGYGYGGPRVVVGIGPGVVYQPYPYYYAPPAYYPARPVYYGREVGSDSIAVDVQRKLSDFGYYRGPIDGVVGPGTRSAIAAYQRENDLEVTGSINGRLLRSMRL